MANQAREKSQAGSSVLHICVDSFFTAVGGVVPVFRRSTSLNRTLGWRYLFAWRHGRRDGRFPRVHRHAGSGGRNWHFLRSDRGVPILSGPVAQFQFDVFVPVQLHVFSRGWSFATSQIIGPLPTLIVERGDRSGNVFTSITPVLAVVTDEAFQPRPNPEEVASVFYLPLARFLSDGKIGSHF